MYIEDWDSFYVQAEELWRREPLKTRYCIKYRHTEGNLVLKVTDDVTVRRPIPPRLSQGPQIAALPVITPNSKWPMQCLKYKTDQLVDVKRMEKLNNLMFLLMSRGADASAGAQRAGAARCARRRLFKGAAHGALWRQPSAPAHCHLQQCSGSLQPQPAPGTLHNKPTPNRPPIPNLSAAAADEEMQAAEQQQQQQQAAAGGSSKSRGKGGAGAGRRKG